MSLAYIGHLCGRFTTHSGWRYFHSSVCRRIGNTLTSRSVLIGSKAPQNSVHIFPDSYYESLITLSQLRPIEIQSFNAALQFDKQNIDHDDHAVKLYVLPKLYYAFEQKRDPVIKSKDS